MFFGTVQPKGGVFRRHRFERDDLLWLAALLPPLVFRCFQDGADFALQRLSMLAVLFLTAAVWSALLSRNSPPLGAQLRFSVLFALLTYEPVPWSEAVLAGSFGWVFAREVFGGKPVLSPVIVALAFALLLDPAAAIEEEWITNAGADTWMAAACLPGTLWLMWRRKLAWAVPLGVAAGVYGGTAYFGFQIPGGTHLMIGTLPVAALFVAADMRFTPRAVPAQILYGVLVGALVVALRLVNPYQPDGVVYGVLFASLFAPLIGRLLAWRPGGQEPVRD